MVKCIANVVKIPNWWQINFCVIGNTEKKQFHSAKNVFYRSGPWFLNTRYIDAAVCTLTVDDNNQEPAILDVNEARRRRGDLSRFISILIWYGIVDRSDKWHTSSSNSNIHCSTLHPSDSTLYKVKIYINGVSTLFTFD